MPPEPKRLYDGPERPLNEVAIISAGCQPFINVRKIDGQGINLTRPVQGIHVEPGKHDVEVFYSTNVSLRGFESAKPVVSKQFRSGHSYFLTWQRQGDTVYVDLVDKGNNYDQACMLPEVHCRLYQGGGLPAGC